MLKLSIFKKIIGYGALISLVTSNVAVAQIASDNTGHQNGEAVSQKALSDPLFARQLSNSLAQCHGFLYALHDKLTDEVEMNFDAIELENSFSQMAQIAGYASVLTATFHGVDIEAAHTYANSISRDERIAWTFKLEEAKDNILIISTPRIGECSQHMPVAKWLFDGAVQTKVNQDRNNGQFR